MTQIDGATLTETPIAEELLICPIHSTLVSYFETFNQADFQATAALFAQTGKLLPPFETAIVGPEAISAYLMKEAKGMMAYPRQSTQQKLPSDEVDAVVVGQVHTPFFKVNVKWQFLLNPQSEILQVQIKLLAALKDLLHLRPHSDRPPVT